MIHANVKEIREAKGISQSHVADKLGMTPQGYRHIEIGNSRLTVEVLRVIAKVLDEDVSVFFDRKLTESVIERIKGGIESVARG